MIVRDVRFDLRASETFSLVGESGSGKSTIARSIGGLLGPLAGQITFEGRALGATVESRSKDVRREIQLVLQNPDASLNPRQRVHQIVGRPLELFFGLHGKARRAGVEQALEDVRLDAAFASRYPDELSGGERQRVAIARALAAKPRLMLCDEILSALDVSVQTSIVELLRQLQADQGIAYLFISHDLAVVRSLSHRVGVLYLGELCEVGSAEEVYAPPYHPYTHMLLSAVPEIDGESEVSSAVRADPGPSSSRPPSACPFADRCPWKVGPVCDDVEPPWRATSDGHMLRCHIPLDELARRAANSGIRVGSLQREDPTPNVTVVALAPYFSDSHGARIDAASGGRVERLVLRGFPGEADLSDVEIAVYGLTEGPVSFRELSEQMPRLRWIHSTGAGIESFATQALADRGVIVTNSAGIYAPAMAEYAIAGMVAIARDLRRLIVQQDERRWHHEPISGSELYGKRVGIVGYGATGRYLATICKALGMEVWATRRTRTLTMGEPVDRLLGTEDLHELLAASDFVVVTASLNSSTRHLLGEAQFAALKPGAGLVNVARGGVIDQDALLAALADGRVGGAVLDVVTPQPLPPESPLWSHPRVIVTPHISGGTSEGWARSLDLFVLNLPHYLDGDLTHLGGLVDLRDHL